MTKSEYRQGVPDVNEPITIERLDNAIAITAYLTL
jgi:hypothetical protein